MKKKLKMNVLIGLGFAGVSYIVVRFAGFTQQSYMALAYLYIILAGFLTLRHEVKARGGIKSVLDRLIVVVDEEEREVLKLLSGEKYRMDGELEKLS